MYGHGRPSTLRRGVPGGGRALAGTRTARTRRATTARSAPPTSSTQAIAWQRRIFDAGYAGIHWPTSIGGRGLTIDHKAAWIEQCAVAGVPPFLNMVGLVLAGQSIMRFGTPEQQRQHLRRRSTADQVWCQLFSEPGAGSDLGGLTHPRRARRRPVHRQRPEGVVQRRSLQRLGHPDGAHGPRRARSTRASRSSCSRWTCPASRCARSSR